MLSIGVPQVTFLTLGTSTLAAWAGTDNDVTPSSSRLFRHTNEGMCDISHDEPPREIPA
jgi:hypothetical protein